jgi:uncharacterized protein YdcH (DUF465 family)
MSNTATREDVDEVIDLLKVFMKQVDGRFNEMEIKYNRLIDTIDGFIGRIDKYETELAARDAQFDRLIEWARKVSAKTGIPLKDL